MTDNQNLNDAKKTAIHHLTEALGEEARSEPDSPEEAAAREHRAEAEQEITQAREQKK